MLALRGVHPTPEQAEAALKEVRDAPPPSKPTSRRPLARLGAEHQGAADLRRVPGPAEARTRSRSATRSSRPPAGIAIGVAVWLTTWVLPLTFMVAMAWACESHTRQLGRRVLLFYDGEADSAREAIEAAERAPMTGDRPPADPPRRCALPLDRDPDRLHRRGRLLPAVHGDRLARSAGRARRALAHRHDHRRHRPQVVGHRSSGRDDACDGRGP